MIDAFQAVGLAALRQTVMHVAVAPKLRHTNGLFGTDLFAVFVEATILGTTVVIALAGFPVLKAEVHTDSFETCESLPLAAVQMNIWIANSSLRDAIVRNVIFANPPVSHWIIPTISGTAFLTLFTGLEILLADLTLLPHTPIAFATFGRDPIFSLTSERRLFDAFLVFEAFLDSIRPKQTFVVSAAGFTVNTFFLEFLANRASLPIVTISLATFFWDVHSFLLAISSQLHTTIGRTNCVGSFFVPVARH